MKYDKIAIKGMRILQLGKFYPIRGGVEKVMYDILLGLTANEVYCDMLCAATENHPGGTIVLNKYGRILIVPTCLKLASTMIAPEMVRTLRRLKDSYDIIHIHHPDPMAALSLYLSGFKGKVVLHWHSDILRQKTLLRMYRPLQNWLIRRADVIVGTTPVYVENSVFLKDVSYKTDFIPIGILPIAEDRSKVAVIKNRFKGKKLIFSLGRMVEYKGFEYLLSSALFLEDDFHILIGGKGPLEETLKKKVVELKLENRVSFLGYVSDEEVGDYFHAADLFCLSSIYKTEAFAIVQIEAMSCGIPIVSAHIPGSGVSWVNQDGDSGLVVEKKNPEALAMAFRSILSDKEIYKSLCEGSRRRYIENFTREKMIDKCLLIYLETFGSRKTAPLLGKEK